MLRTMSKLTQFPGAAAAARAEAEWGCPKCRWEEGGRREGVGRKGCVIEAVVWVGQVRVYTLVGGVERRQGCVLSRRAIVGVLLGHPF